MRISDLSSVVCSSDLQDTLAAQIAANGIGKAPERRLRGCVCRERGAREPNGIRQYVDNRAAAVSGDHGREDLAGPHRAIVVRLEDLARESCDQRIQEVRVQERKSAVRGKGGEVRGDL